MKKAKFAALSFPLNTGTEPWWWCLSLTQWRWCHSRSQHPGRCSSGSSGAERFWTSCSYSSPALLELQEDKSRTLETVGRRWTHTDTCSRRIQELKSTLGAYLLQTQGRREPAGAELQLGRPCLGFCLGLRVGLLLQVCEDVAVRSRRSPGCIYSCARESES